MEKFNPKVSIVIPVYNGAKHVGAAIDSALAQTYKNIEIIVANDGSNDDGATEKVARSYGDKIIYLHQEKNGGAATVLNLAIEHMTGEYFSWLSHDDLYYPNKIERQVAELAKLENKNTIMMSELDGITEDGAKLYQTDYLSHIKEHPGRLKSSIYPVVYNKTHGCTLLIPKKCFDEVGVFDPKERVAQDFEFFYRAFLKFPSQLVPETLVTARDTSDRMGRRAKPRAIEEYSRLYMHIINNLSEQEILWLARNPLVFYMDMFTFFHEAGYTIAEDYIKSKISDFLPTYIDDLLKNVFRCELNRKQLEGELSDIIQAQTIIATEESLNMVDCVDKAIYQSIKRNQSSSIHNDCLTDVYESLSKKELKRSAAYALSACIANPKNGDEVRDLVNKYLIDDDEKTSNSLSLIVDIITQSKDKPRLMFCSTHWLTGGMERVMSNLFRQLINDYDIFLLTPYDGRLGAVELPRGVKNIRVSNRIFYNNFDGVALTYAFLLQIDVVIGFYNLFDSQLELYRLCQGTGIKTVASNHEYYFYPYRNHAFWNLVNKRLAVFKKVDAVIWPTSLSANIYGLVAENGYAVGNPNTFEVIKADSYIDNKNIIAVGRFGDYVKRVDRILRVFSKVLDYEPEAKLLLVGKYDIDQPIGPDRLTIRNLMAELRITKESIQLIGEVDNVDKYYKQAKVLLMTSDNEGFGMVINEAASLGVPSVCGYFPGVEDLIENQKNGFVIASDDIATIAQRVSDIINDNRLHKKLSQSARQYVQRFRSDVVANQWKVILYSLINENSFSQIREEMNKLTEQPKIDYRQLSGILLNETSRIVANDQGTRAIKELSEIHNSRSWKVTKPLRLLTKTQRSLKQDGIKTTVKKVVKKVTKKLITH